LFKKKPILVKILTKQKTKNPDEENLPEEVQSTLASARNDEHFQGFLQYCKSMEHYWRDDPNFELRCAQQHVMKMRSRNLGPRKAKGIAGLHSDFKQSIAGAPENEALIY